MIKKTILLLGVVLFAFLLHGCNRSQEYPFPNRDEPIENIELLYYPWFEDSRAGEFGDIKLVRLLESDEVEPFMNAIYALPTSRAGYEPPSNYGAYIARVNYVNGDTEYFGSYHIDLDKYGETATAVGLYRFTGDAFKELYFEYAGDFLLQGSP